MSKNLLDDIFNAPEEDVKTFSDIVKEKFPEETELDKREASNLASDQADATKLASGEPDKAKYDADLVEQISGFISIKHGWHGDDYVWHFDAIHPKKPWAVREERILYAIAKTLREFIPQETRINLHPPLNYMEVTVSEYTAKVLDIRHAWNVRKEDFERATVRLFEVMNTLV
jgi:hypothetical protein